MQSGIKNPFRRVRCAEWVLCGAILGPYEPPSVDNRHRRRDISRITIDADDLVAHICAGVLCGVEYWSSAPVLCQRGIEGLCGGGGIGIANGGFRDIRAGVKSDVSVRA